MASRVGMRFGSVTQERALLDHSDFSQACDLVLAEAELLQHLLGLLAEFRRPRHHPARRARQRHGLADQAEVIRHLLRDAFRLSMIGAGSDLKVFWSNGLVSSITTLAIVLLFWPAIEKVARGIS